MAEKQALLLYNHVVMEDYVQKSRVFLTFYPRRAYFRERIYMRQQENPLLWDIDRLARLRVIRLKLQRIHHLLMMIQAYAFVVDRYFCVKLMEAYSLLSPLCDLYGGATATP